MEALQIILVWGVIPIVIAFYFYQSKKARHDTVIKLLELGGDLDPKLLESLTGRQKTYKDDYRYGIIWLAVGIPSIVGGFLESDLAAVAFLSIFAFVGLAYLLSGKLRLRE